MQVTVLSNTTSRGIVSGDNPTEEPQLQVTVLSNTTSRGIVGRQSNRGSTVAGDSPKQYHKQV